MNSNGEFFFQIHNVWKSTSMIFGNLICSNFYHLPASKGYPIESNDFMVMVLDSGE